MRNVHGSLALCLLVVLTANAQSTNGPGDEIEVRGVFSIPSGEARFSNSGTVGTTVSFSRDFDFRSELGFDVRYTHWSANRKHKFLGEYSSTSWSRTSILSRSFTFLGETYVANLEASGDLKLRTFRAMYAYRWGNEKIRFGPMADMGVVSTRLKVTGTTNNGTRTAEGSITKFAATLGYDVDYNPVSDVRIFHNLGAIAFSGERLFHTEGGLNYFPVKYFGVSGGYKFQRYKVVDNEDFLTIRSHGPFFGGILRF